MKNVQKDKSKLLRFLKSENLGKEISFLGEGWSSFAYKVDDYIVRISKTSVREYEYEKKVCDYLRSRLSVQLPDIKVVKNRKYPYAVHKEIKGNHFDFDFHELDDNKLVEQSAKFLYDLHSVNKKDIARKIPHVKSVRYLYLSKADLTDTYSDYFSLQEIDELYVRYEKVKKVKSSKTFFIHRDFSPWNIIVDEKNDLVGMIDFVNSGIDELEFEFIRFYRKTENYGAGSKRSLFLNPLIDSYEKISGVKVDKNRIKELAFADLLQSGVLISEPKLKSFKSEKFNWIINELKNFEK